MSGKMGELFSVLPDYLGGHLLLAVPAIVVGVFISVPLGILCARVGAVRTPLMTVASLGQTIPSIAMLAIMVALLGGTIGYRPAFIALLIYSMLPILRNTLTGVEGVDPSLKEAALGVGMTSRQSLLRVELPLALPVILAGIRTATVWVVGITTLSTPVGAASLGNYIFSGLQLRDWNQVYFGCLFAMGLTLVLDQTVHLFEEAARRQKPLFAWIAGSVLVVILGLGLAPALMKAGKGAGSRPESGVVGQPGQVREAPEVEEPLRGKSYTIGAKGFTEQAILSRWIAQVLEKQGASVEIRGNMGSTILFDALRNDTLDLYVDYSGTIWTTVMDRDKPVGRSAMFIEVAHFLLREHDITAQGRLGFENSYCLAMRRNRADELGIDSIGDLEAHTGDFTLGGSPEFFGRPEWTRVRDLYELGDLQTRGMDPTFMYQAVQDGQVDLIGAFSSDGRINAFDLVVLEDPEQAFPSYDAMILTSPGASEDVALRSVLGKLINTIDVQRMRETNQLVDIEGKSPSEAAATLPFGKNASSQP